MSKLNRFVFVLGLFVVLSMKSVFAAPAPFGLELGKTTIKQMKAKYMASLTGVNKYSHSKMFSLQPSELGIEGVKSATAIFDKKGKLAAVLVTLPNYKFDSLYRSLRQKYQVTSSVIPFVGNKKVVMKDGETEITLNSPHMSFDMNLNYINESLLRAYRKESQQEQQQKQRREMNNL